MRKENSNRLTPRRAIEAFQIELKPCEEIDKEPVKM
jgi:hypothetical protein